MQKINWSAIGEEKHFVLEFNAMRIAVQRNAHKRVAMVHDALTELRKRSGDSLHKAASAFLIREIWLYNVLQFKDSSGHTKVYSTRCPM